MPRTSPSCARHPPLGRGAPRGPARVAYACRSATRWRLQLPAWFDSGTGHLLPRWRQRKTQWVESLPRARLNWEFESLRRHVFPSIGDPRAFFVLSPRRLSVKRMLVSGNGGPIPPPPTLASVAQLAGGNSALTPCGSFKEIGRAHV